MAKFVFRLQGMLNIKQKLEDQRKQEYGAAMAEVEREKRKKQELIDEKELKIAEFRSRVGAEVDVKSAAPYNHYIEYLKRQAVLQDKAILDAQIKAEKKRAELVNAMKERKTLEKLSERQYEEYQIEQKLAEQKTIDEIVSYRFDNK